MRTNHKADRDLLLGLIDAISVSKVRLRRDECGHWNIVGRRGHVSTDGVNGYAYLACKTKRRWEAAKSALGGLVVTQDGDLEGVIRLDDVPSELLAAELRRLLGLRKSVRPSDKQRTTLARFHFRRDSSGVSDPSIAATEVGRPLPAITDCEKSRKARDQFVATT
jgi:hypothetical protein